MRKYLLTSRRTMSCTRVLGGMGAFDTTLIKGSSSSGGWNEAAREDGGVGSTAVLAVFRRFLERLFLTVSLRETSTLGSRGVNAAMRRVEEVGGVMGVKMNGPDLMVRSTDDVDEGVFLGAGEADDADLMEESTTTAACTPTTRREEEDGPDLMD